MSQSDHIFKQTFRRHFAELFASQNIRLGDYCTMQNGQFVQIENLRTSNGIELKEIVDVGKKCRISSQIDQFDQYEILSWNQRISKNL